MEEDDISPERLQAVRDHAQQAGKGIRDTVAENVLLAGRELAEKLIGAPGPEEAKRAMLIYARRIEHHAARAGVLAFEGALLAAFVGWGVDDEEVRQGVTDGINKALRSINDAFIAHDQDLED